MISGVALPILTTQYTLQEALLAAKVRFWPMAAVELGLERTLQAQYAHRHTLQVSTLFDVQQDVGRKQG